MKLQQLSNGNWIDLSTVTEIKTLEREQCFDGGPILAARVVLVCNGGFQVVLCDDIQQANAMRDEFARLVNAL
jgi:hypothetical protein